MSPCMKSGLRQGEGCKGHCAETGSSGRNHYAFDSLRPKMATGAPSRLAYQPKSAFARFEDPSLAPARGKRIGILIVTYNAIAPTAACAKAKADSTERAEQRGRGGS